MKTKLIPIILCLIFVVSAVMTVVVSGATFGQDGLEASLTFSKTEYAAKEQAIATLTVTNKNLYAVHDVQTEIILPSDVSLASGTLKQDAIALASGESMTQKFALQQAEATADSDDNGRVILIVVLASVMILSGTVLLVIFLKRNAKGTVSMILCLAMLAGMIPAALINAAAVDKSFSVEETVRMNGKDVTVKVQISYTHGEGITHTVTVARPTAMSEALWSQVKLPDLTAVPAGRTIDQMEKPTLEGYTFAGWFYDSELTNAASGSDRVDAAMTLYPKFDEGASIAAVTFYSVKVAYPATMSEEDRAATILPDEQLMTRGELVYAMPTPYRAGYTFVGWYYDSALAVLASVDDIVDKNMILYPRLVPTDEAAAVGDGAMNYVAAEEVDTAFRVTVKAPSASAVEQGISFVGITDGNETMAFTVTDNGNGTYTIEPVGGIKPGKTYQITATDRETLATPENPIPEDSEYILFIHEGEVQRKEIRYYNVFTYRDEEYNLRIDDGVQFIDLSKVFGFGMSDAVGLYSARMDQDGGISLVDNDAEGTFVYEGTPALKVGDVVAIHKGDVDLTAGTMSADTEVAYIEITMVDGTTYHYVSAKATDVIFLPDVIPVPVGADQDGDALNLSITIDAELLDFSLFEKQEALNSETVVGKDDYIVFYDGVLGEVEEASSYAKITGIRYEGDTAIITYETTTLAEMQSAIDTYSVNGIVVDLPESEVVYLENKLAQQAEDSGFVEEAAAYAVQNSLGIRETIVWGESYAVSPTRLSTYGIDVDAGNIMLQIEIGRPNVKADVTTKLKKVTQINKATGLRVDFGVTVPVGIEMVEQFTGKVVESLTMDLYLTFEQEVAFNTRFSVDVKWDNWLKIVWWIDDVAVDATFEMGTYTGFGAIFTISTEKYYEKTYLWNELVEKEDGTDIFSSASSIAKKLNQALSQGDLTFFGEMGDTEGTLVEKYEEMLQREIDYFDILALPLFHQKGYLDPKTHIVNYILDIELIFAAKLNVTMGISFENLNVKQYNFSFRLFDGKGSANSVDKQTPYTNFNFFIMGNLGVRAGIGVTFTVGLVSTKLDNIGVHIEVGPYLELYGFYYYHFEKIGNAKPTVKSSGAMYVEIGIYLAMDFFAGVFLDLLSVEVHLVDESWKIWGTDTQWYPIKTEIPETAVTQYNDDSFSISNRYFNVREFNVVTGEWRTSTRNIGDYEQATASTWTAGRDASKFTYDPATQRFTVHPDFTDIELSADFTFVLKESNEILGDVTKTIHLTWKKTEPTYPIQYYTGTGISYTYVNGDWEGKPIVDDSKTQMALAGSTLPALPNYEYSQAGYDFVGWCIDCPSQPDIHGKMLEDVNFLEGYVMPNCEIGLNPIKTPRTDTPYTVRHNLESLDQPGKYELISEEVCTGRTGACIYQFNFLDMPGIQVDYTKYPVQEIIPFVDENGEKYNIIVYYLIYGDGSAVVDYYYTRKSYTVGIHANNPALGSDQTNTSYYNLKMGETIPRPGYEGIQNEFFSFVGWSTSPTGPVEFETLPDEVPAVEGSTINYYGVWSYENVSVTFNYFDRDPETKAYPTNPTHTETRMVPISTVIDYSLLRPTDKSYEMGYMEKYTAYYSGVELDSFAYTKKFVDTESYYRDLTINVYYTFTYYQVFFNHKLYYYRADKEIEFPAGPEKPGYVFKGWRSNYVGEEDDLHAAGDVLLVRRNEYFTPVYETAGDTPYTVNHYYESFIKGRYDDPVVEHLTGATESRVTPAVKSLTGFDTPTAREVTISADGTTVVNYYYNRSTYHVYLDANGGMVRGNNTGVYRYGESFYLFEDGYSVTKTGMTFLGWYLSTDATQTLLDPTTLVSGDEIYSCSDLTFVAKYADKPVEYHVEHYLEQLDGSYKLQQTDKLTGNLNGTVSARGTTIVGFTWDQTVNGTVTSGTITSEHDTLVLKLYYTRNSYDAAWYAYDGTTLLGTTKVKYGDTVKAPTLTDSRDGYGFNGWNVGSVTMTTAGASFNTKDHGKWTANTYSVTFNANGGTGSMTAQSFTYDAVQTLKANAFVRSGWTFAGWNTKANGSGISYDDQAEVRNLAASGSVTLYAQWSESPSISYTVEHYFENLAGTAFTLDASKTQTFEGAVDSTVRAGAITVAGFTFDPAHASNVTSATLTQGSRDVVLRLYYTRNSYTLTFDFAGESLKQAVLNEENYQMEIRGFDVADRTITLRYGASIADSVAQISVADGEFPGYVFNGWSGLTDTMPAKDLTLTAQWSPIKIAVTFTPGSYYWFNSNVVLESVTVLYDYGSSIELPDHFAMDGMTIIGWLVGEVQGNYPTIVDWPAPLVYGYLDGFAEGEEITIAPFWVQDFNLGVITFNGNGAEGSMDPLYFCNSSGYQCGYLPKNRFVKEGYVFVGWNTAADGSGESVDSTWFNLSGDTTLYAQWEPVG